MEMKQKEGKAQNRTAFPSLPFPSLPRAVTL